MQKSIEPALNGFLYHVCSETRGNSSYTPGREQARLGYRSMYIPAMPARPDAAIAAQCGWARRMLAMQRGWIVHARNYRNYANPAHAGGGAFAENSARVWCGIAKSILCGGALFPGARFATHREAQIVQE